MDELDIINSMLAVVGEHPVSSLSSLHPTVVVAKEILDTENYAVQSKGWFFNTETDVTLKPAADGSIILPSNTLKVKVAGKKYTQRGRVLYNLEEHTDKFTEDVQVDLTYKIDIADLPPNAHLYLKACARVAMFLNDDGEGNKQARLEAARDDAYRALYSEHVWFVNQNMTSSPQVSGIMKGGA